MKSFADLKANARAALLGRYSTLIGAGLISWLISALLETPFSRMLQEGVRKVSITPVSSASSGDIPVWSLSVWSVHYLPLEQCTCM